LEKPGSDSNRILDPGLRLAVGCACDQAVSLDTDDAADDPRHEDPPNN